MKGDYVLDTSALIAYIESESGADIIEAIVRNDSVFVPWAALVELYYVALQESDEDEALFRYASVKDAPGITVLWDVGDPLLFTAARIKAANHLSFADALVAAYAVQQEAALVHKDPEFDALGDLVPVIRLPCKGKSSAHDK